MSLTDSSFEKRGRRPHSTSPATRYLALKASSSGMRLDDIAALLSISSRTMRKWYRDELEAGKAAAWKAGLAPIQRSTRRFNTHIKRPISVLFQELTSRPSPML